MSLTELLSHCWVALMPITFLSGGMTQSFPADAELREDYSLELREDGNLELRDAP